MKCGLLKRTAIALFVGSIVSTYAMAEDDTTNTLKSAVSKLATSIRDDLLPAIATNRTDIDKNTSNIKELAVGIQDNILPALEANRTDIDANKAAIDELAKATDKAVTNLGNAVSGLDEDLAGTQDAVAENRKDIDKNTSNIKELAVGIQDNILPALEANRTDIDANKAAIGELAKATDEAVTNLGNAVSGLDEDLAGTQDAVAENRKDIDKNTSNIKELAVGIQDNILPALEANRTDIDKNASRITDTRNKQVLQNARIDANKAALETKADKTALEAKADKTALEAKADKTALEAKADKTALEAKADKTALEAKADKTALEAKADKVYVGSLEQNIRDNSNRIETNKVAVSALRNDINSHAKRLDHLDNRVNKLDKDLKRGLATQAALTGLFQPYTVGKANFTAAVGGYKSQTAVAIGTGYRYNKHVATKAGVAFTQGGAAYNVGVNFEW
uniref:YadA C-terminal domain-containing protein n=1 Tax=Haemophilus parahaemolyticus TaxID=735 RepID=UPI001CEC256E|nr:YadA C-terminal domain-containing protein [Haemophilus parahaemolyticus]